MTGMALTSQELLELSAVPIPANPEAVARAIACGVGDEGRGRTVLSCWRAA
jgi:hypothetical protein